MLVAGMGSSRTEIRHAAKGGLDFEIQIVPSREIG